MERFPDDENFDVGQELEEEEKSFPHTVESVKNAIAALPDGYRSVLSLYLIEGYDHGEIADILGITESTSKSQFNRSKKRWKEILEQKRSPGS
jgi:RNA polymerase sigma-70 factor (ECF subfamily)